MAVVSLKARYVFPVAGPPIPDGIVSWDGDRIIAVGRKPAASDLCDLGNVALLPGLVNAHTHLDFSDLTLPLGPERAGFADWIRRVMARACAGRDLRRAVTVGLQESLRQGVTTLGETAQSDWPFDVLDGGMRVTLFHELIAPTRDRVAAALQRVDTLPDSDARQQQGLGPHATFTVHPELLEAVVRRSAERRLPVAMHLAESDEELDLMRSGGGPLRRLLDELGAWDGETIRAGSRPMDYLRRLAVADRALIVHGGYLDDEEIAWLADRADRIAVVYCPRTHAWFGRRAYPLERMLAAGVCVALGTDGRGSSPDLSLLAEMRAVARWHPTIDSAMVLRMGTSLGSRALGCGHQAGTLEPGRRADIAVVALPRRDDVDPHRLLFESDEPVVRCFLGGRDVSLSVGE
ncbi:MAG: amidohydrolase family protein [Planctomycetaceae bacterium]|nr:amidohydrolase family protein [Planctomycetaceae bacterium]